MSTPKVIRAAQSLLRQVSRMARDLSKGLVSWLLRSLLIIGRQPLSKAGFVLPTTVLLLLVVVLTVGAISYRTFTRTQQASTQRQQQVVYNAATPVIDRAKSKLEFLFDPNKDSRAGGVPSQKTLLGMMLNDERDLGDGVRVTHFPDDKSVDPYTLDGEERIDINGDGQKDNAWRYRVDLDGDGNVNTAGKDGWAVYSIIFTAPPNSDTLRDARLTGWQTRANALQVRNAPLSNASQANNICQRNEASGAPLINGDGWFPDQRNTTKLRKNFQVNAYVVPDNPTGTVATLEFQQDREATQGFKWAAWFRNDLEIFPGPRFNWNGAMHTEGNLIVGGGDSFHGYLVSAPQSCINSKDASEITAKLNLKDDQKGILDFRGRIITGTIRDNNFNGGPRFDVVTNAGARETVVMGAAQDSVNPGSLRPIDFALEPVELQTNGRSKPRNPTVTSATFEDNNWKGGKLNDSGQGRMRNLDKVTTPYVDDTFRADNRWGPKPVWGPKGLPIGVLSEENAGAGATVDIGEPITGVQELTGSDPLPGADTSTVGLDGYWERRARVDGLRLIVGQRLELGDPAGWGGPGGYGSSETSIDVRKEPLRPWLEGCAGNTCNEQRQRKALWDNLAAVQSTAIYHNATDTTADERDFPDACLVTTIHPGTPTTLDRSSTFEQLAYGIPAAAFDNAYTPESIISDFFRGRGTNGWQFSTPTAANFKNTNSALMQTLRNLANFAGDPNGGTPSFKPSQIAGGAVHPYPSMAMWGDFSNLRQVFKLIDSGTPYDNLSPADKTTLHTAACTLGMLAYNLDYVEKLKVYDLTPASDPTRGTGILQTLAGFRDDEVTPFGSTTPVGVAGLDLTNDNILRSPDYSAGLRGRIRVIDHIAKGYINAARALLIPANQRPPANFIASLAELNPAVGEPDGGMRLLAWDAKQSNNPETYVRLLERWRDDGATSAPQKDELNKIISLAQLIITKEQVARDRTWGFKGNYGAQTYGVDGLVSTGPLGDCGFKIDDANKSLYGGWLLDTPLPFKGQNLANSSTDTVPQLPDPFNRLCSSRPRYPILYSLFPAKLEDATTVPVGNLTAAYASVFKSHKDISDTSEQQFTRDNEESSKLKFGKYIRDENATVTYRVVQPSAIALQPLRMNQSGITLGSAGTAWTLPTDPGTPGTGSTPNSNQFNLIKACNDRCSEPNNANSTAFQTPKTGTLIRVAFKDGAFFNGREMLPVRTLDLDLNMMRSKAHNGDWWLPKKGIVYAFREDGVSESSIVRPNSGNTWESCDSDAELQTAACAMRTHDVSAFDSKDPPLNENNLITPKPVDYYADPDRRPHGFRLRQGASLKRAGDEGRGLSLISDNPVYVQGDFNLHQQGSTRLEEFTQLLQFNGDGSYSNFYNRTDLDLSFADRNKDDWRPSEVVADAVTLISSNFCDGSIEDSFASAGATTIPAWLRTRYGCGASASVTSYLDQNRPEVALAATDTGTPAFDKRAIWVRTNLIDNFPRAMRNADVPAAGRNYAEGESPFFIAERGEPAYWGNVSGESKRYAKTYMDMTDNKPLIGATNNTRMNLIMVSGLVPSRQGQSYGGLHNFPRFIETWNNLFISGAILQLNFSNYATAPFDQETWQIGSPAPTTNTELIRYYSPPNRRWGYDVALQYAPSGPVAQRFQFAEDTRSEFYNEPPANDPYIRNLCKQVPGKAATCPT